MRVVYIGKQLKVLRYRNTYLVVRIDKGLHSQHGHFKSYHGAKEFVSLIESGYLPYSAYYRECARRLLTEKEYAELKTHKERIDRENVR